MTTLAYAFDFGLDLFPLLAGTLAAITCGLLGNFLVLRRLSLMGDAISHSVLPGLVIAFLIVSTRSPIAMLLGAAGAGVLTVVLVELIKKYGRVEAGAAMGVVFSVLFALGVLLIEQAAVRHVDLDADCVLHGQLETLVWFDAPATLAELFRVETLAHVPRQVWTLAGMCAAAFVFVGLFYKELRLAAFDPALSTTLGFHAGFMHYLLMVFVAAATVAAFEAVGSILVIAMLICPGATARLLTDRLGAQIAWSVALAALAGIGGYLGATAIPELFERDAVNAAGSITVAAGVLLTLAIIAAPRYGLITKALRRRRMARTITRDDLLATLYRIEEAAPGSRAEPVAIRELTARFPARPLRAAARDAARRAFVHADAHGLTLTEAGRQAASELVRRHRLWEHYLVEHVGLHPDHAHPTAEQLEHLPPQPPPGPTTDPHGREIPR